MRCIRLQRGGGGRLECCCPLPARLTGLPTFSTEVIPSQWLYLLAHQYPGLLKRLIHITFSK